MIYISRFLLVVNQGNILRHYILYGCFGFLVRGKFPSLRQWFCIDWDILCLCSAVLATHERVLGYLRADNHTTAAKIAKDLDMSARQIERIMADLKAKGLIRRVGANRNGYWEVQD